MYIVLNRALSGHGFCDLVSYGDMHYLFIQKQSMFINGFLNTIKIFMFGYKLMSYKFVTFVLHYENKS